MKQKGQQKSGRRGWMVPAREKLSYFVGAGSFFTVHSFVSTFLASYLLMIGVSTTISATVLLFLKAWDAINDVLFGYFLDKVRFKPQTRKLLGWLLNGKYLPWYRLASFILPVSSIVMFTVNTQAPIELRVLQYVIGYILYDFAFTLASAPFGCMLTSMTSNADERTFLQSYSVLGQGIGSLPVGFIGTALIAGGLGYSGAAIVFSIYGFILSLPMLFLVTERNTGEFSQVSEQQYSLKDMRNFLKESKEFLLFELGTLLWGLFYTSGYHLFLAYYIFGNVSISLIYMALGVIPTIALIPLFPIIFKRINKITCIRIACVLYGISSLIIWSMGPDGAKASLGLHYALYAVCGCTYAFTMIGSSMLLPDIAEITKFRTQKEHVGIIFSIHSFVTKLVSSLVTSVSLLILGAYGFVSVTAQSFEELAELNAKGIGLQTQTALRGLWNVTFLFPAFGFLAAAILFSFCRINSKQIPVIIRANLGEITYDEASRQLTK